MDPNIPLEFNQDNNTRVAWLAGFEAGREVGFTEGQDNIYEALAEGHLDLDNLL